MSASRYADLPHVCREAQLLRGDAVDVGDGLAAEGPGDELDVGALDVGHDHDVHLGQEVEGELVVGVAEDGLLDEDDVGS